MVNLSVRMCLWKLMERRQPTDWMYKGLWDVFRSVPCNFCSTAVIPWLHQGWMSNPHLNPVLSLLYYVLSSHSYTLLAMLPSGRLLVMFLCLKMGGKKTLDVDENVKCGGISAFLSCGRPLELHVCTDWHFSLTGVQMSRYFSNPPSPLVS